MIVVFPGHAHLFLDLSITNDIVSFTTDDKRYNFNFDIVGWRCSSLPFLWCICFAIYLFSRVYSNVSDINNIN